MRVVAPTTFGAKTTMKKLYLWLAILGFCLPNSLVLLESIETGNVLLYLDPLHTFSEMFANRIASIFAIDLLFGVLVFFLWSYQVARRRDIKGIGFVWVATMLFGFAFGLPWFLYLLEKRKGPQ